MSFDPQKGIFGQTALSRRAALSTMGIGLGSIAMQSMLGKTKPFPGKVAPGPHFAPKAKNVILVFSAGGVSQLELFDRKPALVRNNGKMVPDHLIKGQRFAFINPKSKLLGTPYSFQRYGDCGMEFSELLPHLSKLVDKTTLVRSMQTDNVNHTPAQVMMATGVERPGRPSMGAWVSYGLGTENSDLPAFVDMYSGKSQSRSPLKPAGFLPSVHQAVSFRSGKDPVYYLSNPSGMSAEDRRATIDTINQLNHKRFDLLGDPQILTRIEQYEMAFRMQRSIPDLVDLKGEPEKTLTDYGADPSKPSLANNLLMARRMVEGRAIRTVAGRRVGSP